MSKDNWIYPDQADFYGHWARRDGQAAVEYYNNTCIHRRELHPHTPNEEYQPYVQQLKEKGYCKIEGFFEKETLLALKNEMVSLIDTNKHIKRQDAHHIVIDQPFLYTNTVQKIAFDQRLIDIATLFFDCTPGIGTCNLRQSLESDLPAEGTHFWHRDFNSPVKFMKFFFYLSDVTEESGPFSYVEESNNKMPNGWWAKHRWTDEDMKTIYGEDKIKHVTANVGDLLMATTNGFHKGHKIQKGTRYMLTVNFLIHPELAGGMEQAPEKRFQMKKEDFDALPENKKPVADFLIKV